MFWSLISWQSVIAGTVTTLAISIIMAILGVALGFSVVKPTSHHPFSGMGTAFSIWSAISIILSLAAGGFVAGLFSGVKGYEHGFMVWATVLLAGTLFSGMAFGSAMRLVGSAVREVGSGAASVVSTVGGGMSHLASSAVDHIRHSVDLTFEHEDIGDEVESIMRDTGIKTLQPDFLHQEMRQARSDLRKSLHALSLHTDNYEQIIDDFIDRQKARLGRITDGIDKDSAVAALMKARNISQTEAQQAVDNAVGVYEKAVDKAKRTLTEAHDELEETKEHLKEMGEHARIKADHFSSSAARSALAAGLALVLGAAICCFAGVYGTRVTARDPSLIEARRSVYMPTEQQMEIVFERPQ
ncbi:MAG: hypothetical protein LIP77_01055 [Planctomycetes bacterium]|nr:hypothetical protein [Planctomycetota bacterium]